MAKVKQPGQKQIDRLYREYERKANLASMGNKAAAWDSINYCKNFYKTPYCQQCCEKLLTDMAEKHRSEMMKSDEALP